jgi:uncharacterized protein YcfL
MKKLFTICTALFALALIGCEDPAEEMFAEIEDQQIEIIDDSNIATSQSKDQDLEMD